MSGYTDQKGLPKVVIWPRESGQPIDVSGMVYSFSASKSLETPEGQFSLTMLPDDSVRHPGPSTVRTLPELYRLIDPGALVSLGMDFHGGIMLGIVSRVSRTHELQVQGNSSRMQKGLTITGADFGRILTQDGIIHASLTSRKQPEFLSKLKTVVGEDHVLTEILPGLWGPTLERGGEKVQGSFESATPAEVVDFLLDKAVSTTIPQLKSIVGGDGKPADIITRDVTIWGDGRIWNAGLNDFNGSLWDFTRQLLDVDFYEVHVQTIPSTTENRLPEVRLVIRPKPFDEQAMEFLPVQEDLTTNWGSLTTLVDGYEHHLVFEHELLSANLGVSNNDSFAYYEVTASFSLIGNDRSRELGLYYPAIDTWTLTRHGLRAYKSRVALVSPDLKTVAEGSSNQSELLAEVYEFRNRLVNWYRLNEWFEVGSITVAGRDEFRPGDPVFLPWAQPRLGDEKGLRYYCVGVSWSWTRGSAYTSRLDLTRGHNAGVIEGARSLIASNAPPDNPTHLVEA